MQIGIQLEYGMYFGNCNKWLGVDPHTEDSLYVVIDKVCF